MAAAADDSVGFFSGVWSRLRSAAFGLRRRGHPSGAGHDDGQNKGQEATVRSRLARRAAAARRVGRNLVFVSFNLEVLVFVYAFWRMRRRNLNWRHPIQALPMLVIPALATLIYAAFIRFTRTFDLKDMKMLKRLQEEKQANDCVPRESDQNEQNSAKTYDLVDDASIFSAEFSKLGKHHQPSINLRDDGGGDMSWGHSKDFQPMQSDGVRRRRFLIEKTDMINSNAVSQPINWPSEHSAEDPEDPDYMQTAVEHPSNSGIDVAENGMAYSSVETGSCLPGLSIVHINSNATDHSVCSLPLSNPKSSGGHAEEDAVRIGLSGPYSDLPAFAELIHAGVEEKESSKFHVSEENRMSFISKKELLVSSYAAKNIEHRLGSTGFTLCSQETEKEDVGGGVSFTKVSPNLSFLSYPELVVEGSKDASKKESCELNTQDENDVVVSSEEEALLGPHVVNTAEQCSGTSGFFLHAQDPNMMEVPAIVSIFAVSPESIYPEPVESPELAENGEDFKGGETSDVDLPERKDQEAFLNPLTVDCNEDSFATSELLSHNEAVKMTEVRGVVNEDLSESQDEGASNHHNGVVTSSDDSRNTENMIDDSVSAQLIAESNIPEALQGGQEALSDPLQHSSCHSTGTFLSSIVISNDEAYSSNSNTYCFYANSVEDEAPLAAEGGLSESKDEMNFAFLDTPILLNEVTGAESLVDNAGSSRCIPDNDRTESLHDVNRAPPKTPESANFCIGESLIHPGQEIKSEIFSLYSRSSSCVSEVSMLETLRGHAFPGQENDHDFSIDEWNPMMVPDMDHADNYTNNTRSAELIPEISITETLNVGKEATACSVHEVSSNFLNSLRAPDVGNGMGKSSSFVPVVDVFEGLQADQGFSELQCENDFTFRKSEVFPKEVKNGGNYLTDTICDLQDSKETLIDALQSAQPGLSKSQDEGVFTLHGTYMSPDGISNAENYLTANCSSDLCNTMGTHFFSQRTPPESQPQEPVGFKEDFVCPAELCVTENNSDNAKSSSFSAEVNSIENMEDDQRGTPQQQDETNLGFGDIYMARQGTTSENHLNNLGYQHISDANTVETFQVAERLSSEILHDGIFSIAGTSISIDSGNNTENSSNSSGSVINIADVSTASLLGVQEGPFKPQDENAKVSASQYEVDSAETHCSNSTDAEATLTGAVEDATGQEGSFEPNDEYPSTFEENSVSENASNNPTSVSHTSMKKCSATASSVTSGSVRSSGKGLPDPLLEDIDIFDKISGDGRANKSLNENVLSCEQIAITLVEIMYTGSQDCTEASNLNCNEAPNINCTEASESVNDGVLEPEHPRGPELVLSQLGPFSIDDGKEAEKDLGSSSTASSHHEIGILGTLQELSVVAASGKGFSEGSKVCEWPRTDKEPNDLETNDMKEDVKDLGEDHENNPIYLFGAVEITPALVQKAPVKLYAKDASWRDLAMGTSNDFEAARVAGLRQRKPLFTISSTTRSSTVSELADMQYTEPVNDDTNPLSAPPPSYVAANTQNRSNDNTVLISVECSPTEQPRKSI